MENFEILTAWIPEMNFFGNSLSELVIAVLLFFAILLAVRLFRKVLLRKFGKMAERTNTQFDDTIFEKISQISGIFYLIFAFFLTTKLVLNVDPASQKIVDGVFFVVLAYEALRLGQAVVFYWLRSSALGKNKTSLQGIQMIVRILLWAIGALLVFSNLGFDVSTLVASLGIGGIAIALAAQNILGDLFSSFTIYFDKPFEVGDYIVVGTHEGTVKKIGLKTTRISALRGEELVISNRELTESRVQNFKKLKRRRVDFEFGVTYDTPVEKLKNIPEIVKSVVEKVELAEFGRTHFHTFDDSSLGFVVVYFVLTGKKFDHMETQQEINLGILSAFEKEKIEMAFPTQTVYLKKD